MKSTLSECAQHLCKCVCVSCVSVSNNIPFSANNIRETSTYLHQDIITKYARLLAAPCPLLAHSGGECIQEEKFKVQTRGMKNALPLPLPPSCKFYGFPQDAFVFNLSVKGTTAFPTQLCGTVW